MSPKYALAVRPQIVSQRVEAAMWILTFLFYVILTFFFVVIITSGVRLVAIATFMGFLG